MSEHEDMVESSWSAIEWFARSNKAGDDIAVEVTADETDDECAMLLSDYVKALGARQLSETVERNVAALLEQNPALAFSVVKSYANTRMFDTSEMYVASLGVVAAACEPCARAAGQPARPGSASSSSPSVRALATSLTSVSGSYGLARKPHTPCAAKRRATSRGS